MTGQNYNQYKSFCSTIWFHILTLALLGSYWLFKNVISSKLWSVAARVNCFSFQGICKGWPKYITALVVNAMTIFSPGRDRTTSSFSFSCKNWHLLGLSFIPKSINDTAVFCVIASASCLDPHSIAKSSIYATASLPSNWFMVSVMNNAEMRGHPCLTHTLHVKVSPPSSCLIVACIQMKMGSTLNPRPMLDET